MSRMRAGADSLGADGIVGVRLEWRPHCEAAEHLEFLAVGTAGRFAAQPGAYRRPNGQAFSSHLSGQYLVTLLATGVCTRSSSTPTGRRRTAEMPPMR